MKGTIRRDFSRTNSGVKYHRAHLQESLQKAEIPPTLWARERTPQLHFNSGGTGIASSWGRVPAIAVSKSEVPLNAHNKDFIHQV